MEFSIEFMSQEITIELVISHVENDGFVLSGCLSEPSRYPNFRLPRITS